MFESLKRIYGTTKNVLYLTNAVKKKWITEYEKIEIMQATK